MRLINLTIAALIISLSSCNKPGKDNTYGSQGDTTCCVGEMAFITDFDSTRPFNVNVYSNLQDYLDRKNPIQEHIGLKHNSSVSVKTERNARLYYEVYSDDYKTTNWALFGSSTFSMDVTANNTFVFMSPSTVASYHRILLPNNSTGSTWTMVGAVDKYGNDISVIFQEYEKHRWITLNRNQKATYKYLSPAGDTITEYYLFTIHTEAWHKITNSFSVELLDISIPGGIESNFRDKAAELHLVGPYSSVHLYTPGTTVPETDSLLFSRGTDEHRFIFRRM